MAKSAVLQISFDIEEDRKIQAAIRSRANTSLAVLEKAFIRNGSGRYLVMRSAVRKKEPVIGSGSRS